jgi:hypothetical protein
MKDTTFGRGGILPECSQAVPAIPCGTGTFEIG